jgi:hypothetical protein
MGLAPVMSVEAGVHSSLLQRLKGNGTPSKMVAFDAGLD